MAASQTFDDGDKLVHGQQGEVTGPGTRSLEGKGVRVRFPGNKGYVNCYLTSVRRLRAASAAAAPPAPHKRDAAHAPCVPATASAAAPQPSLHAQPLAPQPTARVREGWWPRAWCGRAASVAALCLASTSIVSIAVVGIGIVTNALVSHATSKLRDD